MIFEFENIEVLLTLLVKRPRKITSSWEEY